MVNPILLIWTIFGAAIVHLWLSVRRLRQRAGYQPGQIYLFSPANLLANLFPRLKYVTVGTNWGFNWKHDSFSEFGQDIISITSLLPFPEVSLFLADPIATKDMTSSRARFPKPVEQYGLLEFFGQNIVASEGEQWKKYRKISAPAFSDRNNKLVWDEAMKITEDMIDTVWHKQDVVHIDHCVEITLPIALFVIGVAAFGKRMSWEDEEVPSGHSMTLKCALHVVTTDFIFKALLPNWALGLTSRLRKVRDGFDELRRYMKEMIAERKNTLTTARHDLFSSFIEANDGDDQVTLDESEIIGNIFIFLVAGHETTAHTLCFTFALLALYPDEQEKLFQQIDSLMPEGSLPSYEEMPKFTYSMAVFYETLRMFPPVNFIPKVAAEDTSLSTTNLHGQRINVPISKGTYVTILTPGLHYNPRYWKNPHLFNPERFLEDWPRDAFLPFSAGARACIGRKFFETEGIAILTMLISKYKISVKEEPQFSNETFEQRKARILKTGQAFTLSPIRVPLTFTRRV
ncbi:cytochrome P450 [Crepidotus variabilis]|uniref:Cytochrome P450 n=1 Tax=Crepidotus variabilis TaxID=179855 RepID=A0A9P6EK01_9AGAR|nr:cytochrome P450 [Crepidotus variabilis]